MNRKLWEIVPFALKEPELSKLLNGSDSPESSLKVGSSQIGSPLHVIFVTFCIWTIVLADVRIGRFRVGIGYVVDAVAAHNIGRRDIAMNSVMGTLNLLPDSSPSSASSSRLRRRRLLWILLANNTCPKMHHQQYALRALAPLSISPIEFQVGTPL